VLAPLKALNYRLVADAEALADLSEGEALLTKLDNQARPLHAGLPPTSCFFHG
jgi:hypothetical protein